MVQTPRLRYVLMVCCLGFAAPAFGKEHALDLAGFKHISFADIKPSIYSQEAGGVLRVDVEASASFLLQAWAEPRRVRSLSLLWRGQGQLKVRDAKHEQEKAGDDARLRIGLLLQGEAPMVPFFAPAWIKIIKDVMRHPAGELFYLVVDAKAAPGTSWQSPYASGIRMQALPSQPEQGGWMRSSAVFDPVLRVVGLWLMADGDDSKSQFKVWLRQLNLD